MSGDAAMTSSREIGPWIPSFVEAFMAVMNITPELLPLDAISLASVSADNPESEGVALVYQRNPLQL